MSVYIITDRDAGVCKIGYSLTPLKRLTMLKTSSYADLKLDAVIPGDKSCERALHKAHFSAHIRREWFYLTPDIEKLIKTFPYDKIFVRPCELENLKRMDLATYLKANRLTETQFANLVGVQQSTINRLKRGSVPSKELMAKIVAVTDGKVRADDFFGIGEAA